MDVTRPDAGRPEDEEHRPPRRRRWRWAAFVLLLVVVALAAGYLTWAKRAEHRLDELLAELRRNGEPTEPHELVHPPIPTENDAAVDLLAAAALLDKTGAALEAYGRIEFDGPLGAADRATVAALVEGERDVLGKIRDARGKRDADWRIPYQSPVISTLLPHLNDQRTLANLSRAAATHERLGGNDAAAVEHLRDVLAMGDATDSQPFMVAHLVAVGVRAVASDGLGRMAPDLSIRTGAGDASGSEGGATPRQVRDAIRELLDEGRSEAGLRAALRGERVLQLDTTRLLADRKLDLNAISGGAPGGRRGIGAPPLPRGMILGDARMMAVQVGDLLKAYEEAPDYQAFKANAPGMPAPLVKSRMMHVVASILMPSYDRFVLQQFRSRADRRLAAVALALRLYAADHDGQYPPALDDLVPAYLPAVPKDPFAPGGDKPLLYSHADPAAPTVYSVGENGADDGGSLTPTRKRSGAGTFSRWETLDAVLAMKSTPLAKSAAEEEEEKKNAEAEGAE